LLGFVNGIPDENKSEHDDDEGRDSKHRLEFIDFCVDSGHQYKNSSAVSMVALNMTSFVWFFKQQAVTDWISRGFNYRTGLAFIARWLFNTSRRILRMVTVSSR
jgi:hypothetical protein